MAPGMLGSHQVAYLRYVAVGVSEVCGKQDDTFGPVQTHEVGKT